MTAVSPSDVDARHRATSEHARTLLVEAGAGTGKTTVLLGRLVSLLRSGRCRVDRLAAITFSEKSAAEIHVRLRAELELALSGPLGEDEHANLRSARWQLERAQIATIHAFCATLLRERPVEARVDPNFSTLSQFEATLVQTEVWREWLAQEMDRSPLILKQALRAGLTLAHIETLRDFVLDQRDCLTLLPTPVDSPLAKLQATSPQLLMKLSAGKAACRTAADRAFTHIERLEALIPNSSDDATWERFLGHDPREIVASAMIGSKTNWRPASALDDVRALFRQLGELYTEAREQWFHNLTIGLVGWLSGYLRAYAEKKRERSQLDFTDLLLVTREVVKTNLDVRRYFQRRFDCLLVDEFQDTDPLQAEIVFFLAEQEPRAAEWTEVTLRPGKLFLVGDPQQSIYRFRRADLEVYSQVRNLIAQQGEIVVLANNFRTRAPVLTWMNETFAPAFAETASDQPIYQPLTATRTEATGRDLIAVPIPAELLPAGAKREDFRRAEARTIAAMLKQAVTYGTLAVWGDQVKDYRDVAILFRTYRAMDAYEEAFANAGVPYRVVGGRRYSSRQEIEDLRILLLAIERPTDAAIVVAVLRSSMFGFSDEELVQFVSAGGRFDALHPTVPEQLTMAERFAAAFATLRELYADAAELSPPALLYRLYSDSHLIPLFALRPQGAQRVANLLKLIDIAQALTARGERTLAALNRFLTQQDIAGEEEAFLTEDDDNAVRLLTVHKAKGLEFPVVVLADMTEIPRRGRAVKTGIVERLRGTLELRVGPQTLTCTTLGWQKAVAREQTRELAEEWRLRYVAAARVRDHLVLPIWPLAVRDKIEAEELPDQNNGEERPEARSFSFSLTSASQVYVYKSDPMSIEQAVPSFAPPPLITQVPTNTGALHSYEQWNAERLAIREKGRGITGRQVRLALRDVGQEASTIAMLRVTLQQSLAVALKNPEKSVYEVSQTVATLTTPGEELAHQMLACLRTNVSLIQACEARERWIGLPFVLHYNEHVWNGTIDLAFMIKETWTVGHFLFDPLIDEQTPTMSDRNIARLFLHAFALEQLTGRPVREAVLLSVHSASGIKRFSWADNERQAIATALTQPSPKGGTGQ